MIPSRPALKKLLPTEEATLTFAKQVANAIEGGAVLFLHGPLGVGKTTFARGFLHGLGYHGKVKSPTYTLVEPYELGERYIFHFDFFRLHSAKELEHIGIHEYFSPSTICLVEWPEKGFPILSAADLSCYLDFEGEGRKARIVAHSPHGEKILQRILLGE